MASIEKRITADGKTTYRAKVRKKGYPTETATFDRLTDAKAWAATKEAEIKEGRYFKGSVAKRHTLAELVKKYEPFLRDNNKDADKTMRQLGWWVAELGHITLDKLEPTLIGEYRDKLKATQIEGRKDGATRSGPTVNRYLMALSSACQYGVKYLAWLESNPVHRVAKFKESDGREVFLDQEQVITVLDACKATGREDFYLFMLLLLTTGARCGEVESLTWKQVQLDRELILLGKTKNGEKRSLHLVGPALEAMRAYAKVRRIDSKMVFPPTGKAKDHAVFDSLWRRVRAKLPGLEKVRRHDMRHTVGSFLVMSGSDIRTVADVLGHKTLAMAKRYSHLLESHKAAATGKAADMLFANMNKKAEDKAG